MEEQKTAIHIPVKEVEMEEHKLSRSLYMSVMHQTADFNICSATTATESLQPRKCAYTYSCFPDRRCKASLSFSFLAIWAHLVYFLSIHPTLSTKIRDLIPAGNPIILHD